jgi:formate hydrogenlyase transcriptional activator
MEGKFRSDLFCRLNVFPIYSFARTARRHSAAGPPFRAEGSRRMDKSIETIPSETIEAFGKWHWPGNVRELENFIERSVILSSGSVLRAPLAELQAEQGQPAIVDARLKSAEREHIIRVLRECGGLVSGPKGAAIKLGLKRTTLQSKMRKLKISRKDYAA